MVGIHLILGECLLAGWAEVKLALPSCSGIDSVTDEGFLDTLILLRPSSSSQG